MMICNMQLNNIFNNAPNDDHYVSFNLYLLFLFFDIKFIHLINLEAWCDVET